MELYFAPLEGITSYIYRNTHAQLFDGCDAYYAPFIYPSDDEKISAKHLKDVLPKNNKTHKLTVQVLAKDAEPFLNFVRKIKELGYDEVNINIGCPYAMAVKKGRGAGLLKDTVKLDRFLYEVFSKSDIKISVKTRSGYTDGSEIDELMRIYNKYPMSLLILHPRSREDFYNGVPDTAVFERAYKSSVNKICYNGNIFNTADYENVSARFPQLNSVMLGRGAIANPALFREIKGGAPLTRDELIDFSELLSANYYKKLQSETFTLHKLKEVWAYMIWNYPNEKKIFKKIKKAGTISDLLAAITGLPPLMRS